MGTPMKVSRRRVKHYRKALSQAVGCGFSVWGDSFLQDCRNVRQGWFIAIDRGKQRGTLSNLA